MATFTLTKTPLTDDIAPSGTGYAGRTFTVPAALDDGTARPSGGLYIRAEVKTAGGVSVSDGVLVVSLWLKIGGAGGTWTQIGDPQTIPRGRRIVLPFGDLDVDAPGAVQITSVTGTGAASVDLTCEVGVAPPAQVGITGLPKMEPVGFYTAAPPVLGEADVTPFLVDSAGNLKVAMAGGGGTPSFPAAAALSDTTANPTTTTVGAMGMVWDVVGSVWRRMAGYNVASDALTDPALAVPIVGSFLVAWDNAASKWRRLLTDTNGALKARLLDGAGSAQFPNAAAPADAGAYGTLTKLYAKLAASNGTTDDMLRAGLTALSNVVTGFLNVLPSAVYNAAPSTRTEGQFGPLQASASGSLRTREEAFPSGQTVADAMANPLLTQVNVLPQGFNGTTWDRLRAGLSTVQTAFTGMLSTLPTGRFNLARPVLADTNGVVLQVDQYGNLKIVEQGSPDYEDNANDLAWVLMRACSDALGAWSSYQSGTTKVGQTGLSVSVTPGRLRRAHATNTHATNVYWLVVVNKASAPVNNDAVIASMKLIPAGATPTPDCAPIDIPEGLYCSAGVALAISTSPEKVTLPGSSDCHVNALYA